ncbi:MAG: hypothetical protein JSS91_13755 [Bacteroidetes bacterium]|nr:hypothetical protein [Bacteroidota bacterium]
MKYKIKIENAAEENGIIDIKRLNVILSGIIEIATGSIQIRLNGISFTKGRLPKYIDDAVSVKFSGIEKGSTIIRLETEQLNRTLTNFQLNAFRQDEIIDMLGETPMSLFISSFNEALNPDSEKKMLDKPLLKRMENFKKAFCTEEERILISNEKSSGRLVLTEKSFTEIKKIDQDTPESHKIILYGLVEKLEYSKRKVRIITKSGGVDAYLGEKVHTDQIKNYWGRNVTIEGIAFYRYGGKIGAVEIEKIFVPKEEDKYFSGKSSSLTAVQQVSEQINKGKNKSALANLIGKWPGDETDEEFDELIKSMD